MLHFGVLEPPIPLRTTFPLLALLLGLLIAFPFVVWLDNRARGPYVTWYNEECQRLVDKAGLIGRPERDIVSVLGPPSYVWDYGDSSGRRKTYNYAPAGIPFSKFQVHCRDGVVESVEQFDD
jgi:hypothetical protein